MAQITEEDIKQSLVKQFSDLEGAITLPRPRRIFLSATPERFTPVFEFIVKNLDFGHLCTITGLDEGDYLSAIYHLAHTGGIIVNLKVSVPKSNPVIKTVTTIFPGAECYEREMVDLLGMKVEGLAPGNRYPLPDDWPAGEFPLRKDWKAKE